MRSILLACICLCLAPLWAVGQEYPKDINPRTFGLPWTSQKRLQSMLLPDFITVYAAVVEDPDWYYPKPGEKQKPAYTGYSVGGSSYLDVLEEVLKGNPVAMADLIPQTQAIPDYVNNPYPEFPLIMQSAQYWEEWIARYTSPGWAFTRLALYDISPGRTVAAIDAASFAGDAQGMYLASKRDRGLRVLWAMLAADAGWGEAAHDVSGWYKYGYNSGGEESVPQDLEKKQHYLAIAQNSGYYRSFMDSAYDAVTGFQGTPVDLVAAYRDCYIFYWLPQPEDSLLLLERDIPPRNPLTLSDFEGCLQASIKPETPDEKESGKAEHLKRLEEAKKRTNNFAITPEQHAQAKQQARAWMLQHKAQREAALNKERQRRAALTQELRKELAVVVDYIEKHKNPPEPEPEQEKSWWKW